MTKTEGDNMASNRTSNRRCFFLCFFMLLVSCRPVLSKDQYVSFGAIKGQVHIVFGGFDLPLQSVPVYLIQISDAFATEFTNLKTEASPLLKKKSSLEAQLATWNDNVPGRMEKMDEWTQIAEHVIEIEKQRTALFRRHVFRTTYADNQGLYAIYDIPPGKYMVFVEGTVKNRMTIWRADVDLKEGQDITLDFGEHNVGDTRKVYGE